MSVIAFPNIAPRGPGARIDWELRSNTARFLSPLTGSTRTLERGGAHWAATPRYENLNSAEAARMRAFLASFRGQAQRAYLRDFGYEQRGSFPATELFPNTTFENTTGLSSSSGTTLTVSDGVLRATRTAVTANQFAPTVSVITVVQYAPYVLRFITHQGRGAYTSGLTAYDNTIPFLIGPTVTTFGRVDGVVVPLGTSSTPSLLDESVTGPLAGDFFRVSFASFSRCALVDNGPNALVRSKDLTNASWTKTNVTASAAGGAAPSGVGEAQAITEDGTNGFHFVQQVASRTSAAEDLCAYGFFKRRIGTRNVNLFVDDGANNGGSCLFDLNAGTAATAQVVGTGTNPRAFITNMGNGWYFCAIVARCPATTSLRTQILMNNAGANNYAGDSSSSIYGWGMGATRTSVPTRGAQTTDAAVPSGTSQTGAALYLKGLPVSTNGLLLVDDLAEIITPSGSQLVRARAPLNSDAAGLGYFQFEPPLRESPADNAGVIVCNPLMRALLDDRNVRWTQRHAGFVDLDFTLVEDITS